METPKFITSKINELCRKVNPKGQPVFVRVIPESGCEPNDCFQNVRRRVVGQGGRMQYGWAIWEWPNVMLEAEHHAVYELPAGPPWIDITPSLIPNVSRRLFLPDDSAIYDFEVEGIRRDNERLALADDPLIEQFFQLAEERNSIMNSIPGIGEVTLEGTIAERYQENVEETGTLEFALRMKYTPANAPCFCESGKRFRQCHGKEIAQ